MQRDRERERSCGDVNMWKREKKCLLDRFEQYPFVWFFSISIKVCAFGGFCFLIWVCCVLCLCGSFVYFRCFCWFRFWLGIGSWHLEFVRCLRKVLCGGEMIGFWFWLKFVLWWVVVLLVLWKCYCFELEVELVGFGLVWRSCLCACMLLLSFYTF